MKDRLLKQFKGFIETSPLWYDEGPFGILQFNLPSTTNIIPKENDLLTLIPSLAENFVLGKRMESFFSFVIRKSPDMKLVAENLQISKEKITIGEIDFIIEDLKRKELLHVEMVYKIYVYDPSFENEAERWIGPNRRDSLLQKIQKLRDHQFPLLNRPETLQALKSFKIKTKILKQQVCFKAHLFLPRQLAGQSFPLLNNSCVSGYWIHLHEFTPEEFSDHRFFAPKKQDWPIYPQGNEEWYSYQVIHGQVLQLHEKKTSPLLWMHTSHGEFRRIFVVWW